MQPSHVMVIQAPSGRWAIMCRYDENHAWMQVESCATEADAWHYVDHASLDDDALRQYEIAASREDDGTDPDWGDDAPASPPNVL